MGLVLHDIHKPGRQRGSGASTLPGELVTSGAHATSTTASNLTDGAAGAGSAITATVGTVLYLFGDEDMRVKFGGETATATDGALVPASTVREFLVPVSGAVSIIDVA